MSATPEPSPQNALKLTALGGTYSGKTCCLGGLYSDLGPGARDSGGFRMSPADDDPDQKLYRMNDWKSINIAQLRKWPDATDDLSFWQFSLSRDNAGKKPEIKGPFAYFEWMDYPGGNWEVKSKSTSDAKAVTKVVRTHFGESVAFFAALDAIRLTQPNEDQGYGECGAPIIQSAVESYEGDINPDAVILILLTKCDDVDSKYKARNYGELCDEAIRRLDRLIDFLRERFAAIGIVLVSVAGEGVLERRQTAGSVEYIIKGYPKPINLKEALFFCLGKTLDIHTLRAGERIKQNESEQQAVLETSFTKSAINVLRFKGTRIQQLRKLNADHKNLNEIIQLLRPHISEMYKKSLHCVRTL